MAARSTSVALLLCSLCADVHSFGSSMRVRSSFAGTRLNADLSPLVVPTYAARYGPCMPPFLKKLGLKKPEKPEPEPAAPINGGAATPVIKLASDGMGLIKPLFGLEALLQALVLGKLGGVSKEEVVAEIEAAKKANKVLIYTYTLSPFSTEAVALLEKSGYEFTNIPLGLEWFTLGGRASQTRVALSEMVDNGATSLPKIFIDGESIGGASGFSALAEKAATGELVELLRKAKAKKAN